MKIERAVCCRKQITTTIVILEWEPEPSSVDHKMNFKIFKVVQLFFTFFDHYRGKIKI